MTSDDEIFREAVPMIARAKRKPEPLSILALDPATRCGWAHSSGVGGTWDLTVRKDESAGMRLIRLRAKLNEIMRSEGLDLVVYEAARHAAANRALVVQSMLQAAILIWCEEHGVQYRGYSPSEIKKHATGKGGAAKAQMYAAAVEAFGDVFDDNHADALWLLDLALKTLT